MFIPQPSSEHSEALHVAHEAAVTSCSLLLDYFGNTSDHKFKFEGMNVDEGQVGLSIVTEADIAAEKSITAHIQKTFPNDYILGEEQNPVIPDDINQPVWTIDPLDGTANFAKHSENYGTMIAKSEGDHVELGVVYAPSRKEYTYGERGFGTFLNGKKVRVSEWTDIPEWNDVSITIGWKPGNEAEKTATLPYQDVIKQGDILRSIYTEIDAQGRFQQSAYSAAIDGIELLEGKQLIYMGGGMVYDLAPWYILLEEAGYDVFDVYGKPIKWYNGFQVMIASHPAYTKHVIELLQAHQ